MAGSATAPKLTKASGSASGTGALMDKAARQATDRIVTFILVIVDLYVTGYYEHTAPLRMCASIDG